MTGFTQGIGVAEVMIILVSVASLVVPIVLVVALIRALRRRP